MDTGRPLWISHRGYKAVALENTLGAFDAAVQLGFDALETDLRLSSDGHIVLHHDCDLRRLARNPDQIACLTRSELARLKLSDGSQLLFFDEFASKFAGLRWTLDIKPETALGTIDALSRWAQSQNRQAWLIENTRFVLWSPAHERYLLEVFPGASCYAQERECWRAGLAVFTRVSWAGGIKAGRTYSLPPRIGRLRFYNAGLVARFHAYGARVVAFLPETEADEHAALAAHVDEILTNGRVVQPRPLS